MRNAIKSGLAALYASCTILAGIPPAAAQLNLFVSSSGNNSIVVFDRAANGNVAPQRTLIGAATGLSNPAGLFADTRNNELVVTNINDNSVRVYPLTASGNTPPLRTLIGGSTLLDFPVGVLVDTVNDELVVVNRSSQNTSTATRITVYSRTANGDAAPLRSISGPMTGLDLAHFIALDNANNEYIVTSPTVPGGGGTSSIRVFSRTASGDATPVRVISGASTGLNLPIGVALDSVNAEIVVANTLVGGLGGNSVTVYSRIANGDVPALRTIAGNASGFTRPAGVRVDPVNNEILVANQDTATVTAHLRTANGNIAPARSVAGGMTGLVPLISDVALGGKLSCFDIDGNGAADALTDAVILHRALSGITGAAAIEGALGANATRKDWPAIRTFLNAECGLNVGP